MEERTRTHSFEIEVIDHHTREKKHFSLMMFLLELMSKRLQRYCKKV